MLKLKLQSILEKKEEDSKKPTVTLNFSKHIDLLQSLILEAEDEERDLDRHILYLLKDLIK